MNSKKIIKELKKKYPGKKIIKNSEKNPTEILCKIEPSVKHPEYSLAVSVLDKSVPHVHKETTERYKVIKGVLKVFKDGKKFILKEGEGLTINPGEIHWAKGEETWFECYSRPGWAPEDHILVKEK